MSIRKLVIGTSLVLVSSLVSFALLITNVDINRYKPEIVAAVEHFSGRTFEIVGDIKLRPGFVPIVRIDGMRLGNAPWAKHANMLSAEHIEARLAILPLLFGELSLKRLSLDNVEIKLHTNEKGQHNWSLDKALEESQTFVLPSFDIHRLKISSAIVSYQAFDGSTHNLRLYNVGLANKNSQAKLSLTATIAIRGKRVSIDGEIDPIKRIFTDDDYQLSLNFSNPLFSMALDGVIDKPMTLEGFNLSVVASVDEARDALKFINIGPQSLGPLQLTARIEGSLSTLAVNDIDIKQRDNQLSGSSVVTFSSFRPKFIIDLNANTLNISPYINAAASQSAKHNTKFFSTTQLPVDLLMTADLGATVKVQKVLADKLEIFDLDTTILVTEGKMSIPNLAATVGGGKISVNSSIDSSQESPEFFLQIDAKEIALSKLGSVGDNVAFRGGHANFSFVASGSGQSIAAIASRANGHFHLDLFNTKISTGPAAFASDDLILWVFRVLSPATERNSTHIECVALRFPINDGMAANKTGIGIRTTQLNILGGGRINLGNEKITIGANPKPREGIGLNLAGLADFVRIGGTLSNPVPVTDAKGIATAGAKVGAAIATGGLSLLAEGLLDRATSGADVCAFARGEAVASNPQTKSSSNSDIGQKAVDAVKSTGDKVKKVFDGLFSR